MEWIEEAAGVRLCHCREVHGLSFFCSGRGTPALQNQRAVCVRLARNLEAAAAEPYFNPVTSHRSDICC